MKLLRLHVLQPNNVLQDFMVYNLHTLDAATRRPVAVYARKLLCMHQSVVHA